MFRRATTQFLTCTKRSSYDPLRTMSSVGTGGSTGSLGKYKCRRLEGKVAIVTASTLGIGFAIAERLGHEGAHVVVSSRKQKQVDSAVENLKKQGLSVLGLACHVGIKEDRTRLIVETVKKFGGIDILVSNAAVNPLFGPTFEATEESWDKIFDINIKSAFLLSKEVVPYLEKRGGGNIVFVSSIGGYNPFPLIALYSVSKTALLGLVKALVPQCASMNIRVNAIAPGIIKTRFSESLWKDPNVEKTASAQIPMQRYGLPEECSGAVAFLVSDDASYITGETIVMAGGTQSRL